MKLESVSRDVSSGGVMQVATATIAPSKKVFDMFSDQTYANKPLAIMRELVANGIDAHMSAGRTDRPVEVVLPTPFEPTCVIRDFGTGMPHEFVMTKFMAYTDASTKDQDNKAIGGMGIGSKSPFSYVDQYTLRVVHEGVLSVYTMFKNEEGIPAIGLQAQTTTSEPNGVEVSFPVEDGDMETFAEAAQEALQYFLPLPLVKNGTLNPPDYTYVGKNWAMRGKAGPLGVIMGGVRYPTLTASFEWALRNDKRLAPLMEYGIDLTLPIGACNIAMSREALSYTPQTSENVKKALEAVIDDVIDTFANLFDNAPSAWDARIMLSAETGMDSYARTPRAQLLMANAKYRGEKLETSFRPTMAPETKIWLIGPLSDRRRSTGKCPSPKWEDSADFYGITPGRIEKVIIDDLPQTPKSKTIARLKAFIDGQPQVKGILVIRGKDEHQVKTILKQLEQPTEYLLTSSLPEPAAQAKVKGTRPRVRMFTFDGGTDNFTHTTITNLTPSRSKTGRVKEIKYADQPDKGIMVVMNSFELPDKFDKMLKTKLIRCEELVFVNQADAPKIKDNFMNFDKVWDERLAKALAAYPELAERLAVANSGELATWFMTWRELRSCGIPLNARQKKTTFGKIADIHETYVRPLTEEQRLLAPFVTAALPKGVNPKALATAMQQNEDLTILRTELRFSNTSHCRLFVKNI